MVLGLYNPLLMATPVGGASKNEEQFLQFRARMCHLETFNTITFVNAPESATKDGPRVFTKINPLTSTQVPLIPPFKPEWSVQQRILMESKLKRVKVTLITSMPVHKVSLWLWRATQRLVKGERYKRLISFPDVSAPFDEFQFPGSGFADIRLERDKFYYFCWEFNDQIPGGDNFGVQMTTDFFYGNGPLI